LKLLGHELKSQLRAATLLAGSGKGRTIMTYRRLGALALAASFALASPATAQLFGGNPMLNAIQNGSPEDVSGLVLTGAAVNMKDSDGTPTIVLAAHRRNTMIVKILLEAGARPNDAARDGETALTFAAGNGDEEVVVLLLAAKADVNKTGALRETALIRAVRGRHPAVVKLLIDAKADLDQTDASGTTALSLADSLRDTQIASILRKAGAQ
jgi:uncharacterized protein